MSKHPIVHIEISANNLQAAGQFYADIFGWKLEPIPEMNYMTWEAEGGPGGGFNPVSPENPAGTVLVYIDSDDILATCAKIEALGGTIRVPKTEIPGMGWFAVFTDLTGNSLGLFQSMPMQQ